MSGLPSSYYDWNASLEDITESEHNRRRRNSVEGCLDWNLDLDDLIESHKDNTEFRRHSEPINMPSSNRRTRKKELLSVRFGNVEIRECERMMGDNPACETGPSLAIGWRHKTLQPVPIETWEALRCNKRRSSKTGGSLKLNAETRAAVLAQAGFSKQAIERNIQLISYFHEERNETLMSLHLTTASGSTTSASTSSATKAFLEHYHQKRQTQTSSSSSTAHDRSISNEIEC